MESEWEESPPPFSSSCPASPRGFFPSSKLMRVKAGEFFGRGVAPAVLGRGSERRKTTGPRLGRKRGALPIYLAIFSTKSTLSTPPPRLSIHLPVYLLSTVCGRVGSSLTSVEWEGGLDGEGMALTLWTWSACATPRRKSLPFSQDSQASMIFSLLHFLFFSPLTGEEATQLERTDRQAGLFSFRLL